MLYLPQRTSTWGFTDTIAISLKFSFVNLLEKGEAWCFGYLANKQTNKQKEIKTNFLDNNKRLEKKKAKEGKMKKESIVIAKK